MKKLKKKTQYVGGLAIITLTTSSLAVLLTDVDHEDVYVLSFSALLALLGSYGVYFNLDDRKKRFDENYVKKTRDTHMSDTHEKTENISQE